MASASFGRKACELVREIAESEAGALPPYNQDLMRAIADQCADHDALLNTLAREFNEMNDAEDDDGADATAREDEKGSLRTGMFAHHQAILRNKRAIMVYLNERVNRIKDLRWQIGTGLPDNVSSNLSHGERAFFTKYSENLNEYMREVDLNLTLDLEPPKHHKIQVRCLEDRGELFTRDGSVDLKRNTVHLMWREEAQPLIREGVLEQLDDDGC